ncbi:hypothetical protein A2U01_0074253, partial [Trifolium medium]|nr:hypothetical protein [Trifolium medium]
VLPSCFHRLDTNTTVSDIFSRKVPHMEPFRY